MAKDHPASSKSSDDATSSRSTARLIGDVAKAGADVPAEIAGLAKVAGKSVLRAMGTVAQGSIDVTNELVHDLSSGEPVSEIIDSRVEQVRSAAWSALGSRPSERGSHDDELRISGQQLIRESFNAERELSNTHPAFRQILQAISPDEARMLRFLAAAGPQPSLDLRTKTPFQVGSKLIAARINMVADMAGCTRPDRDGRYLDNLNRLGLVELSKEPVEDFRRYSLLTAQPRALDVYHAVKKVQPILHSIHLSSFGQQFCAACFVLEGYKTGGWADSSRDDIIYGKQGRCRCRGSTHA